MTDEDELRQSIACVRDGSLARRDFLVGFSALGIAAPANRDQAVIPVVYRPSVNGIGNGVVAPLSVWDLGLSGLADWYRAG